MSTLTLCLHEPPNKTALIVRLSHLLHIWEDIVHKQANKHALMITSSTTGSLCASGGRQSSNLKFMSSIVNLAPDSLDRISRIAVESWKCTDSLQFYRDSRHSTRMVSEQSFLEDIKPVGLATVSIQSPHHLFNPNRMRPHFAPKNGAQVVKVHEGFFQNHNIR